MSSGDLFFYSIIGFGAGIYFFFRGLLWLKEKRLIENVPTSKIRSLAMGLVEIYGKVLPAERGTMRSPLSNKDCVYYRYRVEEMRGSGKNRHWVTIKRGEEGVPFFLKDETGTVLVDPAGARIEIPVDNEFNSSWGKDPPEQVKKFLNSQGLNFESFLGMNKTMRYREWFVEPGDKLYIMGTAEDNPYLEEATAKNSVEDIMIGKGAHEKNFYISDSEEKEILKKLKWKVIGGVFGGGLLTVGCLAVILLYLNLL